MHPAEDRIIAQPRFQQSVDRVLGRKGVLREEERIGVERCKSCSYLLRVRAGIAFHYQQKALGCGDVAR